MGPLPASSDYYLVHESSMQQLRSGEDWKTQILTEGFQCLSVRRGSVSLNLFLQFASEAHSFCIHSVGWILEQKDFFWSMAFSTPLPWCSISEDFGDCKVGRRQEGDAQQTEIFSSPETLLLGLSQCLPACLAVSILWEEQQRESLGLCWTLYEQITCLNWLGQCSLKEANSCVALKPILL